MPETQHERAMRRVRETREKLLGTEFRLEDTIRPEPTVAVVGSIEEGRAFMYDRDGTEYVVPTSTLIDDTFDRV
jgi:hypothetical protein